MCPITELVHQTLDKVGVQVPPTKRRLSRQMLTNMNIAQLQIIINDFHSFIETLNEVLVKYLMDRDDLSMRQDSMLIDIEDITRYLWVERTFPSVCDAIFFFVWTIRERERKFETMRKHLFSDNNSSSFLLFHLFFRGEKEEAQLNSNGNAIVQPQQKHHIDPKPAFTKSITRTVAATVPAIRTQTKAFTPQQHIANKKSLVVNGNINGYAVKTSISRDKIEQNGLHL